MTRNDSFYIEVDYSNGFKSSLRNTFISNGLTWRHIKMTDPIADIIAKARFHGATTDMIDVQTAKQIRQQIGLDLAVKVEECLSQKDGWSCYQLMQVGDAIREVCQLEAQK